MAHNSNSNYLTLRTIALKDEKLRNKNKESFHIRHSAEEQKMWLAKVYSWLKNFLDLSWLKLEPRNTEKMQENAFFVLEEKLVMTNFPFDRPFKNFFIYLVLWKRRKPEKLLPKFNFSAIQWNQQILKRNFNRKFWR